MSVRWYCAGERALSHARDAISRLSTARYHFGKRNNNSLLCPFTNMSTDEPDELKYFNLFVLRSLIYTDSIQNVLLYNNTIKAVYNCRLSCLFNYKHYKLFEIGCFPHNIFEKLYNIKFAEVPRGAYKLVRINTNPCTSIMYCKQRSIWGFLTPGWYFYPPHPPFSSQWIEYIFLHRKYVLQFS